MAELAMLDKAFHNIMQRFVETGQAPHYLELAADLDLSVEEGRQLVHDLVSRISGAWVHPGTDLIAAFSPFSNLPTHYRISVEGQQKWFGQ